jgi:hypothetical protein
MSWCLLAGRRLVEVTLSLGNKTVKTPGIFPARTALEPAPNDADSLAVDL